MRLFCFPYAGGGASAFASWKKTILPNTGVEIVPVQYPGREQYISKKLISDPNELSDFIVSELDIHSGSFSFWGHSMGGMLAYLVTRKLEETGKPLPEVLMVSAFEPPHVYKGIGSLQTEDKQLFIEIMGKINPGARKTLEIPEIRELFIPILKADMCVCQRFFEQNREMPYNVLKTPIHTFVGAHDTVCDPLIISMWGMYTGTYLGNHVYPGDHFYQKEYERLVIHDILNILTHR